MDKNRILLWGAKSQSLIASIMIERNEVYFKNKRKPGKVYYVLDPFLNKPSYKTKAYFINKKEEFKEILKEVNSFLVCIASNHGKARKLISDHLEKTKMSAISLISKNAYVDETVSLGKGVQIMPGSVIHCFTKVEDYTIINTSSTVDHECTIGKGCHIMGGVSIAGRVSLGDYVTIGTNATILPDIKVGKGSYIGAGSVVTKDTGENQVIVGSPARFLRDNLHKYDLSFFKK